MWCLSAGRVLAPMPARRLTSVSPLSSERYAPKVASSEDA
eukprot:CAMPEP_0183363906 /NCGR_PEP_ID=MMETSP0164_2-20130417/77446_1 /TAXON_ID=221442 /ORGANISM="Coccolithus pelagicus ssp braarudi, Strain PLY182g" /LENGTH=39 /DNA_ID= /DNA_START= /DNA_END= /DNA_ORIENTATION=